MNKFDKIVDRSSESINKGISKASYILLGTTIDFIKFMLLDNNIIIVALGFITASQVGSFANIIVDNVLSPIIYRIISLFYTIDIKTLDKITYKYLGIDFKIGLLISGLIKLMIIFIFAYALYNIADRTNLEKYLSKMNLIKDSLIKN